MYPLVVKRRTCLKQKIVITAAALFASALFAGCDRINQALHNTSQPAAEYRPPVTEEPAVKEEVSDDPNALLAVQYEMDIDLDTENNSMDQTTITAGMHLPAR